MLIFRSIFFQSSTYRARSSSTTLQLMLCSIKNTKWHHKARNNSSMFTPTREKASLYGNCKNERKTVNGKRMKTSKMDVSRFS